MRSVTSRTFWTGPGYLAFRCFRFDETETKDYRTAKLRGGSAPPKLCGGAPRKSLSGFIDRYNPPDNAFD